jgi:hypothetical protein
MIKSAQLMLATILLGVIVSSCLQNGVLAASGALKDGGSTSAAMGGG